MKLKEWMKSKGYKPPSLATAMNTRYGTTFSKTSIYRMVDGHNPSLELAVAIAMFTNAEVGFVDMLSNSVLVHDEIRTTIIEATEEEDFSDLFNEL